MRVGIVTQPLEMNYGGILQNWALQQVLKRLGHEPLTIDAYQRYAGPHIIYRNIANFARWVIRRRCEGRFNLHLPYRGAVRQEFTGAFIEEHIDKTRPIWKYQRSLVERYALDALVVGSDQVWRVEYNSDHIEDMYLAFAQGLPLKRVVYAASFGIDEWQYTPEQTTTCAALAQQMDAISVREHSGIDLCRDHLGVEATCVFDPTLLLNAQDYNDIIDSDTDGDEPYLAVYCLDINDAKRDFFNRLAAERGLQVRYFTMGWHARFTVGQWLAMIARSSMVVTDSFHGTVFSILFGKEFYTLCNPQRGNTRIAGLLTQLGLEQRLVSDVDPVEPGDVAIDWQDVNSRLDAEREHSIRFLSDSLNA